MTTLLQLGVLSKTIMVSKLYFKINSRSKCFVFFFVLTASIAIILKQEKILNYRSLHRTKSAQAVLSKWKMVFYSAMQYWLLEYYLFCLINSVHCKVTLYETMFSLL